MTTTDNMTYAKAITTLKYMAVMEEFELITMAKRENTK